MPLKWLRWSKILYWTFLLVCIFSVFHVIYDCLSECDLISKIIDPLLVIHLHVCLYSESSSLFIVCFSHLQVPKTSTGQILAMRLPSVHHCNRFQLIGLISVEVTLKSILKSVHLFFIAQTRIQNGFIEITVYIFSIINTFWIKKVILCKMMNWWWRELI